ncbi:non-ribosomal peptide synthetase [Streptomyces sp. V1I6]|uniref:non-ribosomal peptide synthetase n=1 Tax=Streptomyces sp. V1I6 TaxID=3042273 RepID=UPI00278683A1|nr:non-ribosomal peptide synthetase [Streptomyces sp. V1I6]MDQ0847817.1 amino acid adenylation domain-containing protein [Streptomyces sp. V1I6]
MPQNDPDTRYEPFALTEVQESFLAGRTLGGGTGAGTQIHLEFEAEHLDTDRMEAAWNDLVAATDMLRARILPDGRQQVLAHVPAYRIERTDLTDAAPAEAAAALERLRHRAREGFDAHTWPLFALRVAHLPGHRARVLFTVDELIADGPSVSLLLQQWYARYTGAAAPTPPGISFRDYVTAAHGRPVPAASLEYWREQLAGVDFGRPLPLAGAADPQAPAHSRLTLRLEPQRWQRVKEAAQQIRATPTALLLALCTAAVQGDAPGPLPVVLTTYNRRPVHRDVARVVGPFLSTSVFVAPPPAGTLEERVDLVRGRLWQDLEHAAVSGIRALRERARTEPDRRGLAVPMVFTSLLGSLSTLAEPGDPAHWATRIDQDASATLTSGVQLESCVQERDGALLLSWDFAPTALDTARTRAAFETLRGLLERLADEGTSALTTPAALTTTPAPAVAGHGDDGRPVPLTDVQSAYLVGRIGGLDGGAQTRVYQEFLLERHDTDRLERAWNRLVAHHPMLRAAVHEDGTLTVAPHDPDDVYRITRHDLTGSADTEAALAATGERLRAGAFPLGSRPMYALEASALPDGTTVLHVLLDALIADARSFALLFGQLFALHDGDESVLTGPADPVPHLRALAERPGSPEDLAARAAWREKFAALPPGPPLPDPAPGATRAHRRAPLGSWRTLSERAAAIGVPADMVLLTAYTDELRAHFADAGPFTVTVVSWDRPASLPGADAMVADFTQLAWVTVDDTLPDDFADRARELWARVRADLERSDVRPGLGELRTRVFRSGGALRLPVVFTRVPEIDPALHPTGVTLRTSQSQTAQVALDHVPLLVGDELAGQWDAADGTLEPAVLDAMFDRYAHRVRQFTTAAPTIPATATPTTPTAAPAGSVAGAGDLYAVADAYVDPDADADAGPRVVGPVDDRTPLTLAGLLESALAGRADRVAVRYEGRTLTYRQLAERTARLAHHLHALGVRPGDHVAVHMDRSPDLVTALVAVVRAGAVYVPVDPANPPERVRYLLADSGARVVVADQAHAAVPTAAGALVVCPDRAADRAALDDRPTTAPAVTVGGDDPVYTIYTSGTTGKPKGCRNSQQGVANRLLWMQERFPLGPADRVAQKTPYGFDVSVWEFFWPLIAGASIVVARPGGHADPAYLARLLHDEQVTVTHFVPSVLGMFLRHPAAARCTTLRYVFASGEALPVATMRHFYEVLGAGTELHNLYGPTEAAIDVTHWACRPDWDEPTVPIGRPVAHTRIHLLDEDLRPVPAGTPGEIVIGGRQVALGYHRRPELNAERFIASPFPDDDPSPRLYRTGDLGLLGEDGQIRYLGRIDNQFKLRGLRIEPEEIEAALTDVPAVAEARVLPVHDEISGEQALAAVCVAAGPDGPPDVSALRRALGETLPAYLVPSRYRFVARLPLTTNGKLDRQAATRLFDTPTAAAAAGGTTAAAEAVTAPVPTPVPAPVPAALPDVDAEVRRAVAEILGVGELDGDADLFDLGATSFTMIRIAQEIERLTGTALPVEALISKPTLNALTALTTPAPVSAAAPAQDGASGGPVTAETVARTAADILGVDHVGPDDDLFDLGATSFTMIRLAQEIETLSGGAQVPVEVLIQSPTPRSIAACATPAAPAAPAPAVPAGRAADVRIALDPKAKAAFKDARVAERRLPETMRRLPVPDAGPAEARALFDATSFREFADGPLPAHDLLSLLSTVTWGELEGRAKRRYPSGGGFYPVQVYVYIAPGAVEAAEPGLYYLHPAERALIAVAPGARYSTDLHVLHNRALVEGSAFGVFLVSTPAAIAPAYGERNAARFSTIEAGHIAQLLLTGAPERGLGLCAVGEMDFDAVRGDFALDADQELLLSLWGGALTPHSRAARAALAPAEQHATAPAAETAPVTDPGAGSDGAQRAVAVVGFAADLPGARTLDELDTLLAAGATATGPAPHDRWAPLHPHARHAGAHVGGYLDDVLSAEAEEFGISAAEGAAIDPQERLLLSVARRCLEDAALTPGRLAAAGQVGVFVGTMWHDHALYGVAARAAQRPGSTHATRGGLAHRTSHAFGLTGPSVVLDTGCVSGLAAVEAAFRAVASGRCDAALAAASNLVLHPDHLDVLSEMGLLAKDADSCAFTDRAGGWQVGEGVGAVLLKPLERALADGDPVHAVLRGGALQHSGTTRQFGIPDPERQEETMRAALDDAGLRPADIGYVEAAAAGAALADALEFTALQRLLAAPGPDPAPVPVGTVKPNTGHLEAASVFAQLGKLIAQFRRAHVYPTRLTSAVNPALARTPGAVALAAPGSDRWRTAQGAPRRALVNGFAGGGSYGSLVVEEPPTPAAAPAGTGSDPALVLPLSADTPGNLADLADRLATAFDNDPALTTAAAARALREGRTDRPARAGLVTDRAQAPAALRDLARRIRAEGAGTVEHRAAAAGEETAALTAWLTGEPVTWPALTTPKASLPATPLTRVTFPLPTPPAGAEGPAAENSADAPPPAPAAVASPAPQTPPVGGPALSERMGALWGIDAPALAGLAAEPAPAPAPAPAPVAAAPAAARDASASDADSAFARLARVVAAETGVDAAQLDPAQDLFALGATSRQLLRIAARITADGGREVALETLFTAADLGALADEAFPAAATV